MKLNYNDYGLAIGLISYSFKTDGKVLFEKEFNRDLFHYHRKHLKEATESEMDTHLYIPKGYRIFGNQGLAILSLIDDYAFCNRIFNGNHTHNNKTEPSWTWSSKIITGVGDTENYLLEKAKETFLRENDRYPYIGIMKMKLDHRLLYGQGLTYIQKTKERIKKEVASGQRNIKFNYIVIDCFDNDEMSVLAFSDTLLVIDNFFKAIKELKETLNGSVETNIFISCHISLGYDIENYKEIDPNSQDANIKLNWICEIKPGCKNIFLKKLSQHYSDLLKTDIIEHITGGCIIQCTVAISCIKTLEEICKNKKLNLYLQRVKISLCLNPSVSEDDKAPSNALSSENNNEHFDLFFIIGLKEALNKCGVSKSIRERLLPLYWLYNENIEKILHSTYFKELKSPLESIKKIVEGFLEDESKSIYQMNEELSRYIIAFKEAFYNRFHRNKHFDLFFLKGLKDALNKCGVSKSIRERLLTLYRLYNESIENILHATYFKELKSPLESIKKIVEGFLEDESKSIYQMDEELSRYIIAFEEAFYNRFHEKGVSNNNLEYNGSIHQHLTSFNFLYKKLLGTFMPPGTETNILHPSRAAFVSITGHERVSSTRMNLQLNINQITYPEFFATTVWKEAANHLMPLFENISFDPNRNNTLEREAFMRFNIWKSFIESDTSFDIIRSALTNDSLGGYLDEVYQIIHERMDRDLLDYIIIDQIVFHFGFHRNFELFWHFYWKTFLQTSMVYSRRGEIDIKLFIDMLLRLLIVRTKEEELSSKKGLYKKLASHQEQNPYDSHMTGLWAACYEKVYNSAKSIYTTLNVYGFSTVCEEQILILEDNLSTENVKKYLHPSSYGINTNIIKERIKNIQKKQNIFSNRELDLSSEANINTVPDDMICLFNAFLLEIMNLDIKEKENIFIRSVPRDRNGIKSELIKNDEIQKHMANILADPFGGGRDS